MYNRQFVLDNNITFQAIKRANDNYFVMLAYFYAKVFTAVDKVLIHYRINYGSSLTGGASNDPLSVYQAYSATYAKLAAEPEFEKVRQSFINKALRAFFYFLSKQSTVQGYEALYNHYKNEVFPKWEFPTEESYYYVAKDYDRYIRVLNMNAVDFMLSEYRNAFDNVRTLKGAKDTLKIKVSDEKEKTKAQKEKVKDLKTQTKELKSENKKLKAENKSLNKRLAAIQQALVTN